MMTDKEVIDLHRHLAHRIGTAVADVMQLIDEPQQQAEVLIMATAVILNGTTTALMEMYEESTGNTTTHKDMLIQLLKVCLTSAKKAKA